MILSPQDLDTINEIENAIKKECGRPWKGVSNYGFFKRVNNGNNYKHLTYLSQACHYFMFYPDDFSRGGTFNFHPDDYFWSASLGTGVRLREDRGVPPSLDNQKTWIRFLMSEFSPFKEFLDTYQVLTVEEVIEKGYYLFKDIGNIPNAILFTFLITSRQSWEFPTSIRQFEKYQNKYPPNIASFLGLCIYEDGKAKFLDGHSPFGQLPLYIYAPRWILRRPQTVKGTYNNWNKHHQFNDTTFALYGATKHVDIIKTHSKMIGKTFKETAENLLAFVESVDLNKIDKEINSRN